MLEEFSRQMGQAADITEEKEEAVRRIFRLHQIAVDNMLLLEHENRYREAYVTLHALGGRCMTAKEAAALFGQAAGGKGWYAPPDTRALITRQPGVVRFLEPGEYRMMYGVARMSKNGSGISGDNYNYSGSSRSGDHEPFRWHGKRRGSGPGEPEGDRALQQLLETGFSARSALKMVNTILLLTGVEQHPATLDLCCVDLCSGVLEAMKMGAVATFVLSDGQADTGRWKSACWRDFRQSRCSFPANSGMMTGSL